MTGLHSRSLFRSQTIATPLIDIALALTSSFGTGSRSPIKVSSIGYGAVSVVTLALDFAWLNIILSGADSILKRRASEFLELHH